jgi:hypothetical protein
MGKTNTEQAKVEIIINGQQANASVNEIRAGIRALTSELNKIPDPLNSPEYLSGLKKLDEMKDKLNDITGKAKETGDSFKSQLSGMVTSIIGWGAVFTAAGAAISGLINFMKEGIKNAMEEEKAIQRLSFVMEGNKDAIKRMLDFREKMVKTTLFTKAEIDNAINYGLSMGRSETETRKMTEAAIALNSATGGMVDIQTALQQIQMSYQGNLGRLKKYTGDLTKEQLINGGAVDVLIKKYGQFSTQGLDTAAGKMTQFTKQWDLFAEHAGQAWLPVLGKMFDALNKLLGSGDNKPKQSFMQDYFDSQEKIMEGLDKKGQDKLIQKNKELAHSYYELYSAASDPKAKTQMSKNYDEQLEVVEKLEKAQKEINKKGPVAPLPETSEAKRYAEKLLEIRQSMEDATVRLITDERDKELTILQDHLERELDKIKGNSQQEQDLRADLIDQANIQGAAINKKYDQKKIEEDLKIEKEKYEAFVKADDQYSENWLQDSKTVLRKMMEMELLNTNLTEEEKYEIKKKYKALTDALEESYSKAGTNNNTSGNEDEQKPGSMLSRSGADKLGEGEFAQKRALLKQEYDYEIKLARGNEDEKKKIDKDYYASLKELTLAQISVYLNMAKQINDDWNNYQNAQLQKDEDANNKKKANLQKQLNANKITQKVYNDTITKMDADLEEKKKKTAHDQAVRQKELAIFNATIAFLQAVIQAANITPPADLVMPILIAAIQGINLAALIATPVPAAAKGKYDVIGQDDGRTYSANWGGKPKTGIYDQPTLISEVGPELVVDAVTTKKIQMNFPWILGAINNARVPQYAAGNYTSTSISGNAPKIIVQNDQEHTIAIQEFNALIKKGIVANVVFDDWRRAQKKVDTIESLASKTTS